VCLTLSCCLFIFISVNPPNGNGTTSIVHEQADTIISGGVRFTATSGTYFFFNPTEMQVCFIRLFPFLSFFAVIVFFGLSSNFFCYFLVVSSEKVIPSNDKSVPVREPFVNVEIEKINSEDVNVLVTSGKFHSPVKQRDA
jgi:hypothetical protein